MINFFIVSLQKESQYLDDANELIELARESGLIDVAFKKYIPFASKCLTHAEVQKSNIEKDMEVVIKLENIYGMIALLAVGIGGCLITIIAEIIICKVFGSKNKK